MVSIKHLSKNKHFLLEKKWKGVETAKPGARKKSKKKAKKNEKTRKTWKNRKTSIEIVKNNEFDNFA